LVLGAIEIPFCTEGFMTNSKPGPAMKS